MGRFLCNCSRDVLSGECVLWYLGTLLVSAVIGGLYFTVRDDFAVIDTNGRPLNEMPGADNRAVVGGCLLFQSVTATEPSHDSAMEGLRMACARGDISEEVCEERHEMLTHDG